MAAIVKQGLNTGLIGYTLKNEFLGDTLYFRQNQIFDYELYSTDTIGRSPARIQSGIYQDFKNRFSGDIRVTMFNIPADYNFPNDSISNAKYKVRVEVRSYDPNIATLQGELGSPYYTGMNYAFWNNYGPQLFDFKEEFNFAQQDNGIKSFSHDISFFLLTGTKPLAVQIVSGLFANDPYTTMGVIANSGGVSVANTTNYVDYYNESYDLIRQNYRFTKRRDILPSALGSGTFDLTHSMDIKEDGTIDVSEKGNVQGNLSFAQASATCDALVGGAYARANTFYTTYSPLAIATVTYGLVNAPVKTTKQYNQQKMTADYEVAFTNSPQFATNGASTAETLTFNTDILGISSVKHDFNFTNNRRKTITDFNTLINNATGISPAKVSAYYALQGYAYNAAMPMKLIHEAANWPSRTNVASVSLDYTNNPKYFRSINGLNFNYLDAHVENNVPSDLIAEYKIINRDAKSSILNYAYQTDKGNIVVSLEVGLGKNANEFASGFRSGYGNYVTALFKYGVQVFMSQFQNIVPTAFTYFLSDAKYAINQDGVLTMALTFTYTLKKYAP